MTTLRSATVDIRVAIKVPCFHPGCTAHEHEITPGMLRDVPGRESECPECCEPVEADHA